MKPEERKADEPAPQAAIAADILRGVPDPLLTLDRESKITTANPAFYEAFGLDPAQTLGRRIDVIGGGLWNIPALRDLLQAVLDQNRTFRDYELDHELPAIGRRTMLLNASPLHPDHGEPSLILLAMKDITDRKAVEEALRHSEQTLRLIFENAKGFAIITMDLDGRVTAWNPGAEDVLGYREEEILGRDARLIFTPEDRERGMATKEINDALMTGRAEDERWHMRKDGSRFWGSGLMLPMYDGDEIRGLMKIMRDMTPQYHLQQEREARTRDLEQAVSKATAEAEQRAQQLETVNRHLYQAEAHERQRLAQLLHDDLQQMLAALDLQLQIAQGREDPSASLKEARSLAAHSIATTRSLSHELSPRVLREQGLAAALQWLGENVRERHHLPVEVAVDEAAAEKVPPEISDGLFQMVRELLFNVVKHAGASQAWLTLEALDDGVRVLVDDDGVGCAPDAAVSGFGLVNISERITAWQGRLSVDQRPGGGCRVNIELPHLPSGD